MAVKSKGEGLGGSPRKRKEEIVLMKGGKREGAANIRRLLGKYKGGFGEGQMAVKKQFEEKTCNILEKKKTHVERGSARHCPWGGVKNGFWALGKGARKVPGKLGC